MSPRIEILTADITTRGVCAIVNAGKGALSGSGGPDAGLWSAVEPRSAPRRSRILAGLPPLHRNPVCGGGAR